LQGKVKTSFSSAPASFVSSPNRFLDAGILSLAYFIGGIPSCLQILLHRISSISLCLGMAALLDVFGLK